MKKNSRIFTKKNFIDIEEIKIDKGIVTDCWSPEYILLFDEFFDSFLTYCINTLFYKIKNVTENSN